jgi:hypothetical protein
VLCYGAFGFGYIIPGTFLPVMARQAVPDPSVFGWSWPLFGAAAATSPLIAAVWARHVGNRRLWILGHLVMAFGVALPVSWPAIGGIMIAALLVGGTFMVITLAGMQEARAMAGPRAPRLMAGLWNRADRRPDAREFYGRCRRESFSPAADRVPDPRGERVRPVPSGRAERHRSRGGRERISTTE